MNLRERAVVSHHSNGLKFSKRRQLIIVSGDGIRRAAAHLDIVEHGVDEIQREPGENASVIDESFLERSSERVDYGVDIEIRRYEEEKRRGIRCQGAQNDIVENGTRECGSGRGG